MKRATNTPYPKPKNTHKNKNKLHSKSKDKKFNPNEYINSLIQQFHDHRFDTVRKRPPSTHRLQRSSALAYTTPITERTISSSKIRSKSSYSQYRKKSIPMRDILRVDLDNVITDDDNIIHFTEETVKSIELRPEISLQPHHFLTPSAAARRIQRAWRKYQTLKVVRKYYVYYKNMLKKQRQDRQQQLKQKERSGDKKRQLQRTLKIKKNHQKAQFARTIRSNIPQLPLSSQLQLSSGNTTKQLIRGPVYQEMLNQTKTIELPLQGQTQIFQSQQYTSKDLKFVIDLFRNKEENASREIDNQLDTYCKLQAQLTPLQCFTSNQSQLSNETQRHQISQGLSPAVFHEMEKVIKQKYQLLRVKIQQQRQNSPGREVQFMHREEQIEGRMRRQLRNIQRCREDYMRSIQQLKESMIKFQVDSSKIQKIEQKVGNPGSRVRKSYSADTLILRSILSEVTFKNFDLDCSIQSRKLPQILLQQSLKRQNRRQESLLPICPTSPPSGLAIGVSNSQTQGSKNSLGCYQFSDGQRIQEELYNNESIVSYNQIQSKRSINEFDEELVSMSNCQSSSSIQISLKEEFQQSSSIAKEDTNALLLKECAQEMQERIQNILVAQIIEEIFTNNKMYAIFKPYIERPFQFRQINDFDIFYFLRTELPEFFQSPQRVMVRFNQKINPNSLQILKLIRDFDFEIDQYELILPQDIFKAYRKTIEENYSIKIKKQTEPNDLDMKLIPQSIAKLVEERSSQRRLKRAKFLSFQRDLKIMYMKSVFNCYNELIIQTKSFYTYMNGRSSIGPGELTLALREYNWQAQQEQYSSIMDQARRKVERIINDKCMLPVFKSYKELQQFQKQMTKQISTELSQNEFKWVNYMDEVLELWQQISITICEEVLQQAVGEIAIVCSLC